MKKRIVFRNWAPDQVGLSEGLSNAQNVVPLAAGGYAPFNKISKFGATLDGVVKGAFACQDTASTVSIFAGTADKLYKYATSASASDVSKVGGYSVGQTERWEFAQFGSRIIATNISDPVQYYDLGSSSLFANLAGSPPQARHIAIVRDFVVLGNLTASQQRIAWSGFNNSEQWTAGTIQSDIQDIQEGGAVQYIVGGEAGFIFLERAIVRMTYVGPPVIFQFDVIERGRGVVAPGSVTTVGTTTFFYDRNGFFAFDPVNGSRPIGAGRVDNWFQGQIVGNAFPLVTAASDPINKLVAWSFISGQAESPQTTPDSLLVYNYQSDEWSFVRFSEGVTSHDMIFPSLTASMTLEDIGNQYSTLESVPFSFDSRVWTGGYAYLGAFSTDHGLANFGGDKLIGFLTSSEIEFIENGRAFITNTRPLSDALEDSVDVTISTISGLGNSSSGSVIQDNRSIPAWASGKTFTVGTEILSDLAPGWTYIKGLDIEFQPDGEI